MHLNDKPEFVELRRMATWEAYQRYRRERPVDAPCRLCEKKSIAEYEHWLLQINDFPYDRFADVHHMLVSRVHTSEAELPAAAYTELRQLKTTFGKHYDYLIESLPGTFSIPDHFHVHLLTIQKT